MSEFKPTHVYDGNDADCYNFKDEESVRYVFEHSGGMAGMAVYKNDWGVLQIVTKSCMPPIAENTKESI